jgi:hypothetical protein
MFSLQNTKIPTKDDLNMIITLNVESENTYSKIFKAVGIVFAKLGVNNVKCKGRPKTLLLLTLSPFSWAFALELFFYPSFFTICPRVFP